MDRNRNDARAFGDVAALVDSETARYINFQTTSAHWSSAGVELEPLLQGQPAGSRQRFELAGQAKTDFYRIIHHPGEAFEHLISAATHQRVLDELTSRQTDLPETCRLVVIDNQAVGMLPGELHTASNAEFLDAVRRAAEASNLDLDGASVRRSHIAPGEVHIEATFGQMVSEPSVGDTVEFGVSLRHSTAGRFASAVELYGYRLVCANGMLAPVCITDGNKRKRLRIRRGGEASLALTLSRIESTAAEAFRGLTGRMRSLQKLTEKPIELGPAIDALVRSNRFSTDVRDELHDALERGEHGGYENEFGLVNLTSYLGQHGPQGRRQNGKPRQVPASVRRRLQLIAGVHAGQDAHLCPHCRRVLSGAN